MTTFVDKYFVNMEALLKPIADSIQTSMKLAINNYPPFNLKKTEDGAYVIEMAVAGFAKQDITVELDGDRLVIKGNASNTDESSRSQFFHQGLAMRPFTRTFGLSDEIEIKNAELINGILRIVMDQLVQEPKKPTKIEVNEVK